MLINLPDRLLIPSLKKLLFVFLFSCFSAALFAQTFTEQTLKSAEIPNSKIVSQTDSFCGAAFFKRLFVQGQSTSGYKIVPAPNGNFFLAASVGERTMMALADRKMEVIWAQSVDMGLGAESVLDMRLDSEGNIIGVGNTSLLPIECFAFKINAADGQLIWRSRLNDPGNSYFTRILEKNSGANYLLFGQTDLVGTGNDSGCDALLVETNRNTGELLWDKHYDLGSCEIVNDVYIANDQIYTCGRYNLVNGGQSRFRGAMTLFDTTGDVQWSRHYLIGNNQDARLYFSALAHENDGLVAFGYGDDGGVSLTATTLQLVRTDLTGVASWAKKYDIVGGNEERATRLFSLSDGYLLFGTFFSPTASREICLLKTDKQGNLLWGKSYGGLGEDRLSDAILMADTLYLIGSRQNAQIFDILIGKVDLNGDVDGQCDFVKSLDVTVSDYAAPLDFSHNLEELDITHNYATAPLPAQTVENNIVTEVICQKICDDSCDKPDAGVFINTVFCATGSLSVQFHIYNSGAIPLPAGTPVSLYDGDPTTTNANLIVTFPTGVPIDTGSYNLVNFDVLSLLLPADPNLIFYVVVNDNGSLNTPFSLDDFPNSGLEECDYSNNLNSYSFAVPQPPALNLGPDIATCSSDDVTLHAGPGFFQYRWQDNSASPSFTATAPGTYWVEVTDNCGFRQIDSVVVTLLPPVEEMRTIEFCPGGWAAIGGNIYTQPGTVYDTLPGSGTDCDTIVTYTLILLPSPTDSKTLSLCPGESVTIGGNVYFAPATVVDTIWPTMCNGCCDTLVTYTLILLTNPVRSETIEFCPGDIVQIGGNEYTQPDTVLDTVPGMGADCDTIVTYTLQFYQNSIIQIQCPANVTVEAAAGTNSAIVNYNLPTANTDCICSSATVELLQGLASGSDFPIGTTQVCYEAGDDCGGSNSCCFNVTVQAAPPEDACDVKQTSCVKFEILGIFQNPAKQRTYRMRVTNSCANKLIYTTFQLPDGVVADAPATNTTYTAPSGRQYEVRNPNFSPAYSIRFKAIGDGIANGESDIFEYTLPPQSEPLFIHATAKLFPQVFAETHLNVFDCPVQQTSSRPAETKDRQGTSSPATSAMTIFPNPASDVLNVQLPNWENQQIQLRVTDAYGRLMFEQTFSIDSNLLRLELPTDWPTGIFYLEALNEKGESRIGRFVRAAK